MAGRRAGRQRLVARLSSGWSCPTGFESVAVPTGLWRVNNHGGAQLVSRLAQRLAALARAAVGAAARTAVGVVRGDGAEPVDVYGAAVGQQFLEVAAGPLDA